MTDSERDQWRGAIDGRMTRVEQDLTGLSREVAILQADTGHIAAQVEGLRQEIRQITSSVTTLTTTVSEWKGGLRMVKVLAGFAVAFSSVTLTLAAFILDRM